MKEIKFRAWINIEEWQGYFYPETRENEYIQFLLYQNGWAVVDYNDKYLKDDEFIVEQFVGAEDKNKTELYCGDKVFDHGSKNIFVIVNSQFKCAFELKDIKTGQHHPISKNISYHRFEKIGTIHENEV